MQSTKYLFTLLLFFSRILLIGNVLYYIVAHSFREQQISFNFITCSLLAVLIFSLIKKKYYSGTINTQNRAVLITGCDSGFGHMLARHLDSCGFYVFATCLFPSGSGAKELRDGCSNRLEILEMDVTNDESVMNAKKYVEENLGTRELWAIVNNAGVLVGLSIEFTDIQRYRDCLEVNTIGTVRVTKAFLPLLKQSRGRVVNVTSLGGRLTLPFLSAYVMSKFAAVAFTDCLRVELNAWGIRVISVEPEPFKTPIGDPEMISNRIDQTFSAVPEDVKNDCGESYFTNLKKLAMMYTNSASSKVENVVMDLDLAIRSEHPDDVYCPSRNIIIGIFYRICLIMPKSVLAFFANFVIQTLYSVIPERVKKNS